MFNTLGVIHRLFSQAFGKSSNQSHKLMLELRVRSGHSTMWQNRFLNLWTSANENFQISNNANYTILIDQSYGKMAENENIWDILEKPYDVAQETISKRTNFISELLIPSSRGSNYEHFGKILSQKLDSTLCYLCNFVCSKRIEKS